MGDIDVIIKKSNVGQGQAPTTPSAPDSEREQGKSSVQNQAVNAALISAGKSIALNGINQFGNLTGNYARSEQINAGMTIAADLMIAATGPVGQIMIAAKYTTQIANSAIDMKNKLDDLELARQRAGYISENGSR